MKTLSFAAIAACLIAVQPALTQESKTDKPKQFIYVLHLVLRLYDDKAWTEDDKAAVQRHFNRFKDAVKTGQLILAGRTLETGEKTFGVAIFEAVDENAARAFMNADPAVIAGVMTAELHPFGVALERKNPQ
jgi:uncharacterized protein YciI